MEENERMQLIQKSNTILDLLKHEVNTSIGADRTLKRLEKVILQPEVLRNLSFEQIIQYMDRVMRRQKEGREFIIDFYRVNSKSQDTQSLLRQCIVASQENSVIEGEVVSPEGEQKIKQKLIDTLDLLLKAQEEQEEV